MIERFSTNGFGSFLVDFERAMAGIEAVMGQPPRSETQKLQFFRQAVEAFKQTLEGIINTCQDGRIALSYAVRMQIADFLIRLPDRDINDFHSLVEHARLTRQAVLNDLEDHLFLHVDTESSDFYVKPLFGWDVSIARFGCAFDIEEGRKCHALGRYTAAVF